MEAAAPLPAALVLTLTLAALALVPLLSLVFLALLVRLAAPLSTVGVNRARLHPELLRRLPPVQPSRAAPVLMIDGVTREVVAGLRARGYPVGSHHSLTYTRASGRSFADGKSGAVRLAHLLPGTGDLVNAIARTQSLGLAEQVAAGVRHIDVRFSKSNGRITVDHGVTFCSLDEAAAEIRAALEFVPDPERLHVKYRVSRYNDPSNGFTDEELGKLLGERLGSGKIVLSYGGHGWSRYARTSDPERVLRLIGAAGGSPVSAVLTPGAGDIVPLALLAVAMAAGCGLLLLLLLLLLPSAVRRARQRR